MKNIKRKLASPAPSIFQHPCFFFGLLAQWWWTCTFWWGYWFIDFLPLEERVALGWITSLFSFPSGWRHAWWRGRNLSESCGWNGLACMLWNGQRMHARPFQHIPTTTLGTAVEYRGFHLLDHALGTNLVRWRLFSLANIFQNRRCCNPHPHHKLCNAGSTASTFSRLRWAAKSWLPSWPTPATLDPTLLSAPCTRIDRLWLHETSGQKKT